MAKNKEHKKMSKSNSASDCSKTQTNDCQNMPSKKSYSNNTQDGCK